ncbi:MAG: hypothetical protein KGI98_12095 [Euryarchaeota archaeon]|nr:hypothetical protein [Euryarchaeota archaeon]MDE1881211.1 hypothetical protein [Euryarchaeota archaeon]
MNKPYVLTGLLVALAVVLAAFFALGFGVGALSLTTVGPSGTSAQYTSTAFNVGQSWGDGMSWRANITNVAMSGNAPITAMLPGALSTQIQFALNMYSTGDCGNTGRPTWEPGSYANWGHWTLQYLVSGSAVPFTGMLDGSSVSTGSGTSWTIQLNGSDHVTIKYCNQNSAGSDRFTPGLGNPSTTYDTHSFQLTGVYAPGTFQVSLQGQYTSCDGSTQFGGLSGTVCYDAYSSDSTVQALPPNGGGIFTTTASTQVVSAGASLTVLNPTSIVNGGTIRAQVTTAYDGPTGYVLQVSCPAPRPCGGQADPAFQTQNVPNNIVTPREFDFTVPRGYATNSSTAGWNTVTIALVANYGVQVQSLPFPVSISPTYQPLQPTLSYSVASAHLYPSIGDTVTVTINAAQRSTSSPIGSIQLTIYYAQPGQGANGGTPGCANSAYWVTVCPFSTLSGTQVTFSGNNASGIYQFTVQPPAGVTAVIVSAVAETTTQQGNASNPLYIPIKPAGCTPGTSCDPGYGQISVWATWGPILLSTAFILVGLIITAWKPVPGFLALVAAGGVVFLLYLLHIFAVLFTVGGGLG